MQINADLIARHMLRMAAEIETLALERDSLLQENEQLKAELSNHQAQAAGPRAVPAPEDRPA